MEDAKGCRLEWGRSWMGQDLENMTSPASMPADGLSKPRSRKGAQTGFRHLCETLVPTKNLESTVEWLADKMELKKTTQKTHTRASHSRKLPQHLAVYTDGSVMKDQSGWGFTVEQGATTTHDLQPITVLTYSLTTEVEAVAHALCWIDPRHDSPTTRAISLPLASILRRSL